MANFQLLSVWPEPATKGLKAGIKNHTQTL
jgi:hypothetical protein